MYRTRILPVPDPVSLGQFRSAESASSSSSPSSLPSSITAHLDHWDAASSAPGLHALATAADRIRHTDVPVGFPTETVYGLGADATRSGAVRGIYSVKGRPSDNPLIVHICDLDMLRGLLGGPVADLPTIYRPLVARFWPGPLTILLPVPRPTQEPATALDAAATLPSSQSHPPTWTLAPEVTAGLSTFGARLPASPLTCTLIRLAGVPLAGPSANASTRPSPTTAQHVVDDLSGRIEVVLDGGACGVGVESTVVDGLCDPPVVLRPGGISLAELRTVPGWERVERAYRDGSKTTDAGGQAAKEGSQEQNGTNDDAEEERPRAPGMKYKHYSPKARVVLYEKRAERAPSSAPVDLVQAIRALRETHVVRAYVPGNTMQEQKQKVVGIIRTGSWPSLRTSLHANDVNGHGHESKNGSTTPQRHGFVQAEASRVDDAPSMTYDLSEYTMAVNHAVVDQRVVVLVLDLDLGRSPPSIAHGLFSALRDLDARGADVILVEGIDDGRDDIAAAVMNRLRKAASEVRYT
ncbi:translation initiation protein sua5 [Niveomyces insectorum RCEF 264]|uniref:Threonylcarbamoyl-AMP synthase n=1 Tax=Niveomyces insectorum RCEF 264 TaxID=1081102 RepID=A0A162MCW0_9HYPO|nr:translation initiation protein sua5 [Niveomyces insectorum RCEF 264]